MTNYEISDEQQSLLNDIRKGRSLLQLKTSEGWEILTDTLEQLRTQAIDQLISVQPGDTENIKAAHAVAYAVTGTINNLRSAVDQAIIRGEKEAPDRLREIEQILSQPQPEYTY